MYYSQNWNIRGSLFILTRNKKSTLYALSKGNGRLLIEHTLKLRYVNRQCSSLTSVIFSEFHQRFENLYRLRDDWQLSITGRFVHACVVQKHYNMWCQCMNERYGHMSVRALENGSNCLQGFQLYLRRKLTVSIKK